jgi:hypothetical protein
VLKSDIFGLIEDRFFSLLRFWLHGGDMPEATIEAHCDVVYSLYMLGEIGSVSPSAIKTFAEAMRQRNLPGWTSETTTPVVLVHNCAYLFGALNLLSKEPAELYDVVLGGRTLDLHQIIDRKSGRPLFPAKWTHHNWRVSHWIGGIPSLVLSIARSGSEFAATFDALILPLREAADALLDKRTGLIRAYKSDLMQLAFRRAYAIRHDPDLGDVGGVAHILWVDHSMGRGYVAVERLLEKARSLFQLHSPFMEAMPYCLDFDIVQIVRTASEQQGGTREADKVRARRMMEDVERFFSRDVSDKYTLHKIPGALATYHECALIAGSDTNAQLSVPPMDIIRVANWL